MFPIHCSQAVREIPIFLELLGDVIPVLAGLGELKKIPVYKLYFHAIMQTTESKHVANGQSSFRQHSLAVWPCTKNYMC